MTETNPAEFLAHVRQDEQKQWIKHSLEDHLQSVAKLAADYAASFGSSDWAHTTGLWHDLGKYQADFQNYIKSASGYDAHIEANSRVDHSTAGAIHAIEKLGKRGRVLAYLIAGHHAGLADWQSDEPGSNLDARLQKKELLENTLAQAIADNILNPALPNSKPGKGVDPALWIRMLFSCLVDADFLDTENFMDGEKATSRSRYPELESLQLRFDHHMEQLSGRSKTTTVNRIRSAILECCKEKATQAPGLFSLTVRMLTAA